MMNPGEVDTTTQANPTPNRRKKKPELEISVPRETAVYIETHGDVELEETTAKTTPKEPCYLPLDYVTEPQQRIEFYRKFAEVNNTESLQTIKNELRDRYGPLPDPVERLILVSDLKWKAFLKNISEIATQRDKLKIMRNGQWVMMNGKFPRLTRKTATARLNEIHKMVQAF